MPQNTCPIILVHGLSGWGPDEMEDYLYWGGFFDLRAFLEENGYTVFVASVGPYSSNWDRAIELYYQIKGGQVDYGAEHCARYVHIQRPEGKCYTEPFYPQWDAQHPVHLVGHSMGGQTIRMLSALLAGKAPMFQNVLCDASGGTFIPGEGWIKSMTTLSCPHNGSSLFDLTNNPAGIAATILEVAGIELTNVVPEDVYNFDLDQWNMHREDNETIGSYLDRVFATVGNTMDFSLRELSTAGAERFNTMVNSSSEDAAAYRFSYANEQTTRGPYDIFYLPDPTMSPFFLTDALIIGSSPLFTDPLHSGISWRENDGLVNTASMKAPRAGCSDTCSPFSGIPEKGLWNFMGTLNADHLDIVGHDQLTPYQIERLKAFYLGLAGLLWSLE